MAIPIKVQHELQPAHRVVMQREPAEGRIAAEIGVAALVDRQRAPDIGPQVFQEESGFHMWPVPAAVEMFDFRENREGFPPGGGAVDGFTGRKRTG